MATHHSTTVFQNSCHVREQVRNSVVGSKTFMLSWDKFIVTQNTRDRSLLYCYTGMNKTCSEHSASKICPVIWTALLTGCHDVMFTAHLNSTVRSYYKMRVYHIPSLAIFQSENVKDRILEVLHYAVFRLLPVLNLSPPPPQCLPLIIHVCLYKLSTSNYSFNTSLSESPTFPFLTYEYINHGSLATESRDWIFLFHI